LAAALLDKPVVARRARIASREVNALLLSESVIGGRIVSRVQRHPELLDVQSDQFG